jgi:hypothetical protein
MGNAENGPTDRAFVGLWCEWLVDQLGGIQHGFTAETVRAVVKDAERELENIWDQQPSIPVIVRTVVYGVLEPLWAAAQSGRRSDDA